MFNIYIKNFNRSGSLVTQETLMQTIPATSEGELKLISPIVKCEMGKAECLDFSIESGTKFYDAFLQMKTYIRIEYDGDTIFYGRVLSIDNSTFRNTRKVRCEGAMSFLLDSPIEGVEETKRPSISILSYMQDLINKHNSYVENDPDKRFILGEVPGQYTAAVSEDQKIKEKNHRYGSDSWTDTKSALEDLRSHYGGYFRTRSSSQGTYLDWMNHYFNYQINTQTIEVGKNILDISNVTEVDNIFTVIIPIGKNNSAKKGSSGQLYIDGYRTDVHGSGKELKVPDIAKIYSDAELNSGYHTASQYKNAINKYGVIYKTVSFADATTKEKLFNDACEWIKNNYQDNVTKFTIKAIDMHQIGQNTSKIMVGDRVNIIYLVGKEDGSFDKQTTTQTCLTISYDLYHPENNSYTFGIPASILTKTYGLKKQAKSVTGGTGKPKGTDEPSIDDTADKRRGGLVEWLSTHRVYYTGPKPYKPSYKDMNQSGDFFYYAEYMGSSGLAMARRKKAEVNPEGVPIHYLREDEMVLPHKKYTPTLWEFAGIDPIYTFEVELAIEHHLPEYIQQIYGINIWDAIGCPAPSEVELSDGSRLKFGNSTNSEGDIKTWLAERWTPIPGDEELFTTSYLGPDGETIKSYMDDKGDWHYWYKKGDDFIECNLRNLSIQAINTENKVGWIVEEDDQGDLKFANPGEMTLAIEEWANGQMVVARMAGEQMYLGNYKTQNFYATSTEHMAQVCGDVEYVDDPSGDPSLTQMVIHSGGGMRSWHAKKNPETGEYERDESGKLIVEEFGVFDNNTLIGGIVAEKLNDGTVKTKVTGDVVELNATNVAKFGIIDPATGTLTGGVVTEKINEQGDTYTKIAGKYLDIEASTVRIGNFSDIKGYETRGDFPGMGKVDITYIAKDTNTPYKWDPTSNTYVEIPHTLRTLNYYQDGINVNGTLRIGNLESTSGELVRTTNEHGTWIHTFEGTSIWKDQDHIVNVAGEYDVITNPDGTKTLRIKSGGGLRIQKDNVDFGVYMTDANTGDTVLTGGIVAEKLNDGTVKTKIKGKFVDIEAKQVRIGDTSNVEAWMGTTDTWKNSTDETLEDYAGLIADRATIGQLNAAKARITTLETDSLKTKDLKANIGKLDVINVKNISATPYENSVCNFHDFNGNDYYGQHYYIYTGGGGPVPVTKVDVRYGIYDLQIVKNGNTYTLQKKDYNNGSGTTWTDIGSFSRAVTGFTGSWSGGVYSMTPIPQGSPTYKIGLSSSCNLWLDVVLQKDLFPTKYESNPKYLQVPIEVVQRPDQYHDAIRTDAKQTKIYDATPVWEDGQTNGRNSVTAADPSVFSTSTSPSSDFDIPTGTSVKSKTSTGKESSAIGITYFESTFNRYQDAKRDVPCIKAKLNSGTIVGLYDLGSFYDNAKSAGVTEGRNSVTAADPSVFSTSTSPSSDFDIPTGTSVKSKTSTGKESSAIGITYFESTFNRYQDAKRDVPCIKAKLNSGTIVGLYDLGSFYDNAKSAGVTEGRNSVTAADPSVFSTSTSPSSDFDIPTGTSVKSKTSTGKESSAIGITYFESTFNRYQDAKRDVPCIKAKLNSGTIVGLYDLGSFYDNAKSAGVTEGRNSVTAADPSVFSTSTSPSSDFDIPTGTSVKSKTSTGKESSAIGITYFESTFNRYQDAKRDVPCIKAKLNSGTIVGLYDLGSFYDNAKSAGVTEGRNSVTASTPDIYATSTSPSSGYGIETSTSVKSKTSTGKESSVSMVTYTKTTYTQYQTGATRNCVDAKLYGTDTVVGRIDTQSLYDDGKSAGDAEGYTRGRNSVTASAPSISLVSTSPTSGYEVPSSTSVKSNTSTGKESASTTVSYTQTTYNRYGGGSNIPCVKAKVGDTVVGLCEISDSNLKASNIKKDVTILGVKGSYNPYPNKVTLNCTRSGPNTAGYYTYTFVVQSRSGSYFSDGNHTFHYE